MIVCVCDCVCVLIVNLGVVYRVTEGGGAVRTRFPFHAIKNQALSRVHRVTFALQPVLYWLLISNYTGMTLLAS